MAESVAIANTSVRQLRLAAIILAPILILLGIVYFFYMRPTMVILGQDFRPEEASAIVTEIGKQHIDYELAGGGRTILVPSDRIDELRLSLVANDIASPGTVGFELFNKSDMGMTDFAQKVNYQRALQGELTRTIMEMDGIASARVHLALPERSLFRANRVKPTAAVTLAPKVGATIDPARVSGIQELVASAVPDLEMDHVAILNERGQLLSQTVAADGADGVSSQTDVELGYAKRIGEEISAVAPELAFEVKVLTVPRIVDPDARPFSADDKDRPYALRVTVMTAAVLSPERQAQLGKAVARIVGARAATGDDIRFVLLPMRSAQISAEPMIDQLPAAQEGRAIAAPRAPMSNWAPIAWFVLLIGVCAVSLVQYRRYQTARTIRLISGLKDQLRLKHGTGA